MGRFLLIVSVVGAAAGCQPAVHILDADLSRGVPQTRPVPPQSFVQSTATKPAPLAAFDPAAAPTPDPR